jgi:hypothetical protein
MPNVKMIPEIPSKFFLKDISSPTPFSYFPCVNTNFRGANGRSRALDAQADALVWKDLGIDFLL